MLKSARVACAVVGVLVLAGGLRAAGDPPGWAYNAPPAPPPGTTPPPPAPPAPDDGSIKNLPGAAKGFTVTEIRNQFGPADWYPGDHPPMPDVVAHGRRPDVRACSLCHYPNGKGRPENAGVSGLPVEYFLKTMDDFRSGARKSAEARKANTNIMIAIARAMTDRELHAAAEYFGSMKWTPWIKVVESQSVPKTRVQGGMFLKLEGSDTEPLGRRIVEMPDNAEHTEMLRDPRSGFTAYVPVGSLQAGKTLVETGGNGKTERCAICHGDGLRGLGPVPPLAGRSPSYLMRQMFDIQQGARSGVWSELMLPAVKKLSEDEMMTIAAYVASMTP
jgi:cytochrome c553